MHRLRQAAGEGAHRSAAKGRHCRATGRGPRLRWPESLSGRRLRASLARSPPRLKAHAILQAHASGLSSSDRCARRGPERIRGDRRRMRGCASLRQACRQGASMARSAPASQTPPSARRAYADAPTRPHGVAPPRCRTASAPAWRRRGISPQRRRLLLSVQGSSPTRLATRQAPPTRRARSTWS